MEYKLLHIFRNTPFGRETLLQAIYFCQMTGAKPDIYIPESTKFIMYFDNDAVQVDLDHSYLTAPHSANSHVNALFQEAGVEFNFIKPEFYTASTLPDIPVNYDFMSCPRSISDISTKIGLGYIGPRVRRIVKSSRFPILITSPVFKKWHSVAVFFGGSVNAVKALKAGILISRLSGKPLDIFTQVENNKPDYYKQVVTDRGLDKQLKECLGQWHFYESGTLEENLYDVPHDALVVLGAYGHGIIKDMFFGSKMEKIQTKITNNLLIVGPNCFGHK